MTLFEKQFITQVKKALLQAPVVVDRPSLTPAAVLLAIVIRNGEPQLLLTRRTMTVAAHKGQIAFPGGVEEPMDRDPTETALREAQEEIGLSPAHVEPLGRLDDLATVTGFRITPIVGLVNAEAPLAPDPREVAEIFEIPLAAFKGRTAHSVVTADIDGTRRRYHQYQIGTRIVWGATAGIIHDFLTRLLQTATN